MQAVTGVMVVVIYQAAICFGCMQLTIMAFRSYHSLNDRFTQAIKNSIRPKNVVATWLLVAAAMVAGRSGSSATVLNTLCGCKRLTLGSGKARECIVQQDARASSCTNKIVI